MCERPITRLADLWDDFLQGTAINDIPKREKQVLERTFYAGAGSALSTVIRGDPASNELGLQIISSLLDECAEYLKGVSERAMEGKDTW